MRFPKSLLEGFQCINFMQYYVFLATILTNHQINPSFRLCCSCFGYELWDMTSPNNTLLLFSTNIFNQDLSYTWFMVIVIDVHYKAHTQKGE